MKLLNAMALVMLVAVTGCDKCGRSSCDGRDGERRAG